jgi:hypothetical protein
VVPLYQPMSMELETDRLTLRPWSKEPHSTQAMSFSLAYLQHREYLAVPRARKEGHRWRFTDIHGATGGLPDLCSRRSAIRGHLMQAGGSAVEVLSSASSRRPQVGCAPWCSLEAS